MKKMFFSLAALCMVIGIFGYYVSEIGAMGATYRIGDRGPAGGWIFYDKGNYWDGWRYLEAAPEDQGKAKWGCYTKSIPGANDPDIGTGKANTAAIISSCEESGIAAKVAVDYRGGGKSDWFLPSQDEFDLMYKNLKKNGIGGFHDDGFYWSSSENHDYYAYYISISYGDWYSERGKGCSFWVRAIRAF